MNLEQAQRQFSPSSCWLNSACYGLPPASAWDEYQQALQQWRDGGLTLQDWDRAVDRSRRSFANLVEIETSQVSIGAQASQMLSMVAASLPDNAHVLAPEEEFTSNLFPWLAQEARGVRVRTVPAAELAAAIDENTDVVAFSLVQSASGAVADIDAITAAAEAAGSLVVGDATQACGWLPINAGRFDALVCGAYKWLLAPRGTCFLTTTPALRERIVPSQAGWYAGMDPHSSYYSPPLRLADDARRLDISPSYDWLGTAPSLEFIEKIGVKAINTHNVDLANQFRDGLDLPPSNSAIVSVDIPHAEERLAAANISASVRDGRVRAAFHLYNTAADVDRALTALRG